jgi:hypothetical protein
MRWRLVMRTFNNYIVWFVGGKHLFDSEFLISAEGDI